MYHPNVSDSRVHDQVFVHQALQEMIDQTDIPEGTRLVIESDNCTGQYKSTQHFYHLQRLSSELNKIIIRMYGIASHGKGEVDHVGGVAKVAVRREIAGGQVFTSSAQIVSFLKNKFGENDTPQYHIVEIHETSLKDERDGDHRKAFKTIGGSSEFQIMVFIPNSTRFKASPRICLCDLCMTEYGSCPLFAHYEVHVQELNQISLRSRIPPPSEIVGEEETAVVLLLLLHQGLHQTIYGS